MSNRAAGATGALSDWFAQPELQPPGICETLELVSAAECRGAKQRRRSSLRPGPSITGLELDREHFPGAGFPGAWVV